MKKSVLSKFRRLMTLTLAMLMVFSFFGCSKQDEPTPTDPVEDQVQTDPTTAEDPTEAPSETATEAPTEAPTEPPVQTVMGTVSANNLNVRSNPSTDSTVLSQLPVNLRVEILEQKTVGETNWGRIGEMTLTNGTKITGGWVNLHYVKIDGQTTETPTEPSTGSATAAQVGIITTAQLNIRKEASGDSERVGSYVKGDKVEILETKTVDGTTWGRTVAGWVSMTYVKLESDDDKTTEVPTNPNPNKGTGTTTGSGTTSGTNTSNVKIVSNGKTTILGYAVVDLSSLNVRSGPGTNYESVGTVSNGDRFAYYQTSGNWLRIKNGWISKNYSYIEGTVADDAMTGKVTSTELNIRSGPDTSYKSNGSLKKDDAVIVLAQVNGWGYTEKGWISMKYVERTYAVGTGVATTDLNARQKARESSDILGTYKKGDSITITELHNGWGLTEKGWVNLKYVKMGSATTSTTNATVTAETLNARKKANDSADILGTYKKGDTVTITEMYDGWGLTEKGWINLNYVVIGASANKANSGNATVKSETLNARQKANASSEILGTYTKGDPVTVTQVVNGWGLTEKGWVNMSYLTLKTGNNTTYKVGKAMVFVNSTLNIRKEAKTNAESVNTYKCGDIVNILEVKDNWGKVLHRNGEYGWINLQYVQY